MKLWKVILATLVIFTAGVVTGSMLVWRLSQSAQIKPIRPPDSRPVPYMLQRPEFFQRMKRELELTPGQALKMEESIRISHARTDPLWEMIGPPLAEELNRVRAEIRAELNTNQQAKFDELLKPRPVKKNPEYTGEKHRKSPPTGGKTKKTPAGQSQPVKTNLPASTNL